MNIRQKLILSVLALVIVVLAGAAGYRLLGLPTLESLYMSVIVITTLGARDVSGLGSAGMIWTIIVVGIGFTTAAFVFSFLVTAFTSGEFRKIAGRRQLENKIKNMRNHYIICGYGRMGKMICDHLSQEKIPFVVIDTSVDVTAELEQKGIMYILGDASEEKVLLQSGVEKAKGLVTVLSHDSDNVYVTLTSRGLNRELLIVARSEYANTESKLLRAGANQVVSPHQMGASRMINILLRPAIVEFVDVAARGVEFELNEIEISEDSKLAGKALKDSKLRQNKGVMVVAVKRSDGTTIFSPDAEALIKPGDILITIGKRGEVQDKFIGE